MTVRFSRFLEGQRVIRHPQNPEKPLVSVVMPTYILRPGGLNQRAIESVLGQSFADFEFIIIDDGSIDGLHQVLLEYQHCDPRIVLVRHEVNSGLHATRVNEGLLLAKGKYIACMFEDDEWQPKGLAQLVETMLQAPGECVVYGAVEWIVHRSDGSTERRTLGEWDFNYASLKNQNKIAHCAVLHPRSLLAASGLYDPHVLLRRLCDYDLWLRMAKIVPFRRCPRIVGRVEAGTRHALGVTVEQDLALTYRYLSTDRNARLKPEAIFDYEVDSLWFVSDPHEANRIREHYLIPFWQQHAALLTPAERKLALASRFRPNRLLVTKADYSTSVDVTLGNFGQVLGEGDQPLAFLQERSLAIADRWNYDTLVLYRTIGASSLNALAQARKQRKPIVYLMDDNMLKFGTGYLAEEFAYLKPGSPGYQVLEQEVAAADLVISYMPQITRDCLERNPRVVELRTNIREQYIQAAKPPEGGKSSGCRLKYAILTGMARKKELHTLWNEFQEFARRHRDEVEFHVWGVDLEQFGSLECATFNRPFNHCYEAYLQALADEKFDFALCPLFDDHDTKLSKSPIKYLEATAAGAVGIYSDAGAYRAVTHGVTGLKVASEPGAWVSALEASFQLSDSERHGMHTAAKEHILGHFTTESQVLEYLAAFEAADLHAALASHSAPDGQAAIAYFFHESLLGGATLHLVQHALVARRYGFKPILCLPEQKQVEADFRQLANRHGLEMTQLPFFATPWWREPTEAEYLRADKIKSWLGERNIRLVHTVTCMTDVALAAYQAGVSLVATLHQHYDPPPEFPGGTPGDAVERMVSAIHSSSLRYARRWQQVLDAPAFCIRAPMAEVSFQSFQTRRERRLPPIPTILISGTLQPRKGQLKAIQAAGILAGQGIRVKLVLLGYDNLAAKYVAECRQLIRALGLESQVTLPGFVRDPQPYYEAADYLLCASEDESFPQSVLWAMASGIPVITTPAGGIRELVRDHFSGVVAADTDAKNLAAAIRQALEMSGEQRQRMLENAHNTARMACSEEVVAYQLLKLYNYATHEGHAPRRQGSADSLPASKLSVVQKSIERQFLASVGTPIAPRRLRPRLYYRVTIGHAHWAGISVQVAACRDEMRFKGLLKCAVFDPDNPRAPLRSSAVHLNGMSSYDWISFHFEPIANSKGRRFQIEFRLETDDPGTRDDFFIFEATDFRTSLLSRAYHKYLRFGRGGNLAYKIRTAR